MVPSSPNPPSTTSNSYTLSLSRSLVCLVADKTLDEFCEEECNSFLSSQTRPNSFLFFLELIELLNVKHGFSLRLFGCRARQILERNSQFISTQPNRFFLGAFLIRFEFEKCVGERGNVEGKAAVLGSHG